MEHSIEEVHTGYNGIREKELESCYTVGPLNLNRVMKRACTVMGVELSLDEKECDALYMLATREGEYLTFENLSEAVWGSESPENTEIILKSIDNMIKQVCSQGSGFMWIEHVPEAGYVFKTHWGHNWKTQSAPVMPISGDETTTGEHTANEPVPGELTANKRTVDGYAGVTPFSIKPSKQRRLPVAAVITGTAAIVAGIILMLLFLFNSPIFKHADVGPDHIEMEDPDVPLASPNLRIGD